MAEPSNDGTSKDGAVNSEYRRYCLQVGHLFVNWSRMENVLTGILKLHLALCIGDDSDRRATALASAIYGSMRFKTSRDTIKRILPIDGASKLTVSFVEAVFAHIGHIEDFRDKLAHQQIGIAHDDLDGFWKITDTITTRDVYRPRVWTFDTEAVSAAAHDLHAVTQRFGQRHVQPPLFQDLDTSPIPWRYKSSMLKLVPQSKLRSPPQQ